MKHFEMSVMIILFMLPIIATIVFCLIEYGWNMCLTPAFVLLGGLSAAFYITFKDEMEDYRKSTSERV